MLEFGCGTGTTAIAHAPFVKQIIASDISIKMLEIAEQRAREAAIGNIRFCQGSLEQLSLENDSFDAVLGLNILHLLENPETTVARVHALLKPGGVFVSSTVLLASVALQWRILLPLLKAVGLAPTLYHLDKQSLIDGLIRAGFTIEKQWQPGKETIFIVARKE